MTTTTKTTISFINKLIKLDSAIRLGKYEVVSAEAIGGMIDALATTTTANPTSSSKLYDRTEAGNLLYLSAMFHQSHAWRDSENDYERDDWSTHEQNLAKARHDLKYRKRMPVNRLVKLMSQDLEFLKATALAGYSGAS